MRYNSASRYASVSGIDLGDIFYSTFISICDKNRQNYLYIYSQKVVHVNIVPSFSSFNRVWSVCTYISAGQEGMAIHYDVHIGLYGVEEDEI